MSATIFTGWHLLTYGTATNIIFVGAAVLVLRSKVRESRDYMAAGDAAYAQAEQRDAAFEETRNKPWYWPTGPAIEADKPLDATVLHVKYPTQELRLVADDPQVAAGLAVLADEVGLVQALSDRPAEDEDEVGDEQPGEALSSVPSRLRSWASDLVDRVHDWLPTLLRQWRERNQLGSGQPSDDEPWVLYDEDELRAQGVSELELKMLREGNASIPYDEATDAEARALEVEAYRKANPPSNPQPEPVRIVRNTTYRKPGETGLYPLVKVVGDKAAGRHRLRPEPEMPAVNASIPTQRTDGE